MEKKCVSLGGNTIKILSYLQTQLLFTCVFWTVLHIVAEIRLLQCSVREFQLLSHCKWVALHDNYPGLLSWSFDSLQVNVLLGYTCAFTSLDTALVPTIIPQAQLPGLASLGCYCGPLPWPLGTADGIMMVCGTLKGIRGDWKMV